MSGTINIDRTQHLAAELFKSRTGLDFLIVPFNGTPALTTALRGGQVDVAIEILGPLMAGSTPRRCARWPFWGTNALRRCPSAHRHESGVANFDVSSWNALAAPAKTPKDVIARLNKEVQAALAHPDVKKKLFELNVQAKGSSPRNWASC